MKIKLVNEWRHAWKWASVRISAAGAVLMAVAEIAGQTWAGLPEDVRASIPHADTIALVLFVIIPLARVLTKEKNDGADQ